MALFKLSEVSEEERKKYLQSIGIDAEKFRNAQETKIKNEQKSENLLPIETKNTDKFPVQEKNTTNNFPIKQKSENNTVTNKKLSEMVQGPSKENNNSQNRFNFRQANQTANKNENKQLNAKVTTEKEQEQIKESGGLEYDTNAIVEAMEINKDNSKGNINSSISHVLSGILEGAKSNFAGVGQSALFPIANALRIAEEVTGKKQQAQEKDNEDDLWSNKVLDMADYLKEESQHHSKVGSMLENNITRDLGTVSNTIGNMAMSAVSNIALPGSGIMETGVSAGGNSAGETLNEDRSNLIQAIATGTAKGAVEGFTEKITGGNMLGKGSLDDLAENIIGNRIKSKAGKKIASKMYEFGGEILEEQISNNAGYVIDKIINNKDLPSFEQWINEANETTKSTFLTTLALNMLGMGGSTYKDSKIDIKDEQAQKYLNEAQKIIDNENIAENIKNNVTNQYNYKNTILSDLKASNLSNETKNEIQQYLKENNITEEQFNEISETLRQGQMSKEEQNDINSNEIKYQYEESDNEKINIFRQDIVNNTNWSNSEQTKNYVNMLEKIILDKDIQIRLDSNLKDNKGNVVNGSYKNGVITINPNSERSGEFLAIHELTHAIGTEEMKRIIQKYRESNTEFNNAVEKLLGTYEASELNDEALADIAGQLFSNQEFINNIANTKPSFFKKIYNEIKYMWHQFRGYKNQNQFINDLYYKWTEAYNSNNKLNDTTNYSIQTDTKGNRYVEIDVEQDIFDGKSKQEQAKIAKEYILNKFRENGLIKNDENIKVTRKTANEYTHPKTALTGEQYSSKMKASTELDNLLEVSNYIKSEQDDGRHVFAKNGWDYYETTFKVGDKTYTGLLNIANGEKGKLLYDITNIKERASNYSVKTVSDTSSSSNNSILPTKENVNNTTKYSKQESENNSGSFSMDNKGRKLSKEQQEFFKNESPEVLDSNGNLLELYHKTQTDFNIFDKNKIGKLGTTFGKGFYFTDNLDYYKNGDIKGDILKKVYLKMENPMVLSNDFKRVLSKNEIEKIVSNINEKRFEDDYLQYKYKISKEDSLKTKKEKVVDYLTNNLEKIETDEDVLNELTPNWFGIEEFSKVFKDSTGYDGIIKRNKKNGSEYIVFESNQIKSVDNKKPTDSPDIRYSKENSTWREYLESHFKSTGTRTDMSKLPIDNKIIENRKQEIINKAQQIEKTNPDFQGLADEIKNNYLGKDFDYNTYKQMNEYLDGLINSDNTFVEQNKKMAQNENMQQIDINKNNGLKEMPLKTKAQKYIQRNKKYFIDNLTKSFQTSYYSNKELLNTTMDNMVNEIAKNGYISNEKSSEIFEELYSKMVKIDTDYYEQYKDVKNEIRNIKFYVPEKVRNSIADYNSFRLSNMGNVILTNNPNNINIDTKYKELSSQYPELFPDNIIEISEQLERIAEVQKDIVKVETNVKAYMDKNMGPEYKLWAKNDFQNELSKFTDEVKLAYRYNDDTAEKTNKLKTQELKDKYSQIPNLRRNYEKVLNTEVLTQKDRVQVDRLLKGEISLDELPKDTNKKGIKNVYEAKMKYQSVLDQIKQNKKEIKLSMKNKAKEIIGDLSKWKDKKMGWLLSRETAGRNIYDVAPKDVADKINKEYVEKYYNNEADAIRAINKYTEQIKDLNLSSRKKYRTTYTIQELVNDKLQDKVVSNKVSEAELVQLFGENRITYEQLQETGVNTEKIINSVNTIRKIYDTLLDEVNTTLLENGFEPISKRKDYFPHFSEVEDSVLSKVSKMIGIDLTGEELPTDIAGRSQNFKPDKKYVANFNERKTNITDFNVLKGFDNYIRNVTDVIYHTNDIMNYRALSESIRDFYNTEDIKNRIQEIQDNENLTFDEKSEKIQEIKNSTANKSNLSNFINWLDNYINILAGKKSLNDRPMEKELSRKMYKCMSNVESRMSANMVGGNFGVAVSNVGVLAQATAELRTDNMLLGMAGTLWNNGKSIIGKKDNSFASESNFITRRRGSETTYVSKLDKVMAPINVSTNVFDDVVSESIVRAKYIQNLRQGMTQQEALENADRYTAGLMADRSKGALPTQFYSKNPFAKMVNMFQVEVNNQYSHFFKDIPRDLNGNKAKIVYAYSKAMIASYFMNELLGMVRGNSTRLLPDPIYIIKDLIRGLSDDDDDNDWETIVGAGEEILGNLPFVSIPVALFGSSFGIDTDNIGRIPISGAFPNINKIGSAIANKNASNDYKLQTVKKELEKPFYSFMLPFGGAQIKKTKEAVKTIVKGKSSTTDKDGNETIQFPIENASTLQKVQAGLFGKYALPEAKDYTEREYKSLNAKQTKMYKESNLPYKQLLDYIDQKLKKDKDKVKYLRSQDMTTEQKWGIYKYDLLSNNKRSDGGSQLSDAEYMINNGVSKKEYMDAFDKAVKYNIDLPSQKEYMQMKQSGLKLDTYIDYKAKLYNANLEREIDNLQKATNEGSEFDTETKESLKTKDKIRVLQNANYTNEEKKAIYSNYIDKDDKTYSILNNTSKFDIDDYLEYKQQKFESDKEDDGTINGKTVSGSAKNKFYDYMDDSNFTYDQKLLLTGMKYKVTNTEREKIFDIIDDFNISKDDKLEIMSKMKGFTVYNNGRVSF